MFDKLKNWYEIGAIDERKLRAFVEKNAITPEEFSQITGKDF